MRDSYGPKYSAAVQQRETGCLAHILVVSNGLEASRTNGRLVSIASNNHVTPEVSF